MTEEQQKLVEENLKLVPYTFNTYFKSRQDIAEDLIQEGNYGLCLASMRYNPDVGKFSTYAVKTIYGTMLKFLNRKDTKYDNVLSLDYSYSEEGDEYTFVDVVEDSDNGIRNFEKDYDLMRLREYLLHFITQDDLEFMVRYKLHKTEFKGDRNQKVRAYSRYKKLTRIVRLRARELHKYRNIS